MRPSSSGTSQQIRELVMANRAIRAPDFASNHDEGVRFTDLTRGLLWGADAIPARMGLFRADGDHAPAAAAAYIGALPGWKREVAARIDEILEREAPHARRSVKWHIPFYGIEGEGRFASRKEPRT